MLPLPFMSPIGLPSEMSPASITSESGLAAVNCSIFPAIKAAPPTSSNWGASVPWIGMIILCGVTLAWVSFTWKMEKLGPVAVKVAVQDLLLSMSTVMAGVVLVEHPLHPANAELFPGIAVMEALLPATYGLAMPEMLPPPLPAARVVSM